MADPSTYRPAPGEIPTAPGVYRFLDEAGRVIYVGKAKNLRARLSSYFQDIAGLHQRTQQMVQTAAAVRWIVVASEIEALSLEYSWIKEYAPRFNVMYRDDKSYPYLAVTVGEEFPRVQVMRGVRKRGVRYFGPYTQPWAIRETLDLLTRVFPVRTCAPGVFRKATRDKRPCLLGHIGKCAAPCAGWVDAYQHRELVDNFCDFMAGRTGPFIRNLEAKMREAAEALDFEAAAKLRDDLSALKRVLERNSVVFTDGTDADVFALVVDELTAAVQVFHVRGGRIRGERGWVVDRAHEENEAELVALLLEQVYGGMSNVSAQGITNTEKKIDPVSVDDVAHTSTNAIPREVLVSVLPVDHEVLQQWLTMRRGAQVRIRVPQRGDKAALLQTVKKNAAETLRLHRTKRVGDLTQRSKALAELGQYLMLERVPLRIECYDISHTMGSEPVGSMVVFEDGAPKKSDYRHFIIRRTDPSLGNDDTGAMTEVLNRRLARLRSEDNHEKGFDEDGYELVSGPDSPFEATKQKFSYRPDLILVDGGKPQVNVVAKVIAEAQMDIAVIGIAKRLEEIWLPDDKFPLILPRSSSALYLLQHLRDESHRFAISHHRKRRDSQMRRSVLDKIPGLGAKRQGVLLRKFGSVKNLGAASVEEIMQVPGIGEVMARTILKYLNEELA